MCPVAWRTQGKSDGEGFSWGRLAGRWGQKIVRGHDVQHQTNLAFGQLQTGDVKTRSAGWRIWRSRKRGEENVLRPALSTAYKYASNDQPLNVVLRDGLKEQRSAKTLLQTIQNRPGNTRVFCVEWQRCDRRCCEQVAERDSGGLAAVYLRERRSPRQARECRQKAGRPLRQDVQIKFAGLDVSES